MTTGQLDEIEKLAETWLSKEKDFYATGRDAALHQFILAMREHALPLVKAVREARDYVADARSEAISVRTTLGYQLEEARAEIERLREAARQVHAFVEILLEGWQPLDSKLTEIHKITKGMVE